MHLQELKKMPYGNCRVLNRFGELIFRCNSDRAAWYLNRDLAAVVGRDPLTIQLNFETKGPGHLGDEYYLSEKENRCVVCGAYDCLTKHHIIPRFYRRCFPVCSKSRNSFDVVVLCIPCHEEYERYAGDLRKELAKEYSVPMSGIGTENNPLLSRVRKKAIALNYHASKMKPDQYERCISILRDYLGRDPVKQDFEDLSRISTYNKLYKDHGEALMTKITDLEAFVMRWRAHFVATMKPEFLPSSWNQDRPLKKDGK